MTTYNTGNPLGSTDPRDLYDNAENLDHAVNSDEDTFQDRLGKSRLTWAGIVKAGSGDPAIAVDAAARAEAYADNAADDADRAEAAASQVQHEADQIAADAAQQAVSGVVVAVDGAVGRAEDAASRSETARDAAFVNADVYPTVADGLAAVADGEQFQVVEGDEIVRYRRDSGSTQTEVARIIANAARRFSPIMTLQTSGTSQAQTGTIPGYTTYSSGDIFWWVPASNNTGPMTININGLGVMNVVTPGGVSVLRGGEIRIGRPYLIRISSAAGVAQVLAGGVPAGGLPEPLLTAQSSGTSESQSATVPHYSEYKAGDTFLWVPSETSSAEGMTLNINSLGPLEVRKSGGIPLSAGDIIKARFALIRVTGVPGNLSFYIVGSVPSDIEATGAAVESASSLAVSNPNLFTANQVAGLDTEGGAGSGIVPDIHNGIPCWSVTGPIRRWGLFSRADINGDTLSAAVRILDWEESSNQDPLIRFLVIQYSSPDSQAGELSRQEVKMSRAEYVPGFLRIENMPIHEDCQSIGLFIGNGFAEEGVVKHRDMLLCAGGDATFRIAPSVTTSAVSREVWVSPDGSNNGSGSASLPFATLARAVEELDGRGTIYLAAGDYGNQQLSAHDVKELRIVGGADSSFGRSLFRYGNKLALTPVSGRAGVFSAPLIKDVSWLWVDGIPDEQTLVPYNEQHSLLNGRAHRLECTKIWHIPADNLVDALDLIEMSATPVCWRDASTNTVYLSLPDGGDASSDVYGAYDDVGFFSNNRGIWTPEGHIELVGLDIRYGNVDVKSFRTSSLTDIRVVGAGHDGFDVGNWSELNLCSAGGCGSGDGLGDGFNAHNHAIWTYRDCYGHDNWDDGESSHQNCKVTGWGNIMEYNGGSGFTPALGAQQILHNCLSRKNSTSSFRTGNKRGGFQVAGDPTPTDPGVITSLEAYNCVSIGDRNGFHDGTASVAPSQRRLMAVNCRVFDAEETAYACAEIRDCTQSGSATAKSAGTVVVNSSIVS